MFVRRLSIAAAILAGYLVFGDALNTSKTSSPQSFVNELGRGIGQMVTGVGTSISRVFQG